MAWLMVTALLVVMASMSPGTAQTDVHPWSDLLGMSWLFYEAQQSGYLPAWNRVTQSNGGWRNNSHTQDGKGPNGVPDLTGGFYDAGDHVKFHLPLSQAMSTLAMGALVHEAGYRSAGQWDAMARNLAWAGQYLIRCHLQASDVPTSNIFVAQVGDTDTDHSYWGRPEQQPDGYRPVWTISSSNPGSDILGSAAATMAGVAMVLNKPGSQQDITLAADLLRHAKQLLAAGVASPGRFSPPSGSNAYISGSYQDDLAWGALMICWADLSGGTDLPLSCIDALNRFDAAFQISGYNVNSDWDNVFLPTASLLLFLAPNLTAASGGLIRMANAKISLDNMVQSWQQNKQACTAQTPDFSICYTPAGLAFLTKWGPLRHTSNIGLVTTVFAATTASSNPASTRTNRCWARSQMLYAAGSNPAGQSFIVGYNGGTKPVTSPHHRSSSCSPNFAVTCDYNAAFLNQGPNPSVLKGALVGGPSNQDVFVNDRQDYITNEVALDYNSGFTGVLAALTEVTARLAQASCSWSTYCAGGCDGAPDSIMPSVRSASPSTNPPTDLESNPCYFKPNIANGFGADCRMNTSLVLNNIAALGQHTLATLTDTQNEVDNVCTNYTITSPTTSNPVFIKSELEACNNNPQCTLFVSEDTGGPPVRCSRMAAAAVSQFCPGTFVRQLFECASFNHSTCASAPECFNSADLFKSANVGLMGQLAAWNSGAWPYESQDCVPSATMDGLSHTDPASYNTIWERVFEELVKFDNGDALFNVSDTSATYFKEVRGWCPNQQAIHTNKLAQVCTTIGHPFYKLAQYDANVTPASNDGYMIASDGTGSLIQNATAVAACLAAGPCQVSQYNAYTDGARSSKVTLIACSPGIDQFVPTFGNLFTLNATGSLNPSPLNAIAKECMAPGNLSNTFSPNGGLDYCLNYTVNLATLFSPSVAPPPSDLSRFPFSACQARSLYGSPYQLAAVPGYTPTATGNRYCFEVQPRYECDSEVGCCDMDVHKVQLLSTLGCHGSINLLTVGTSTWPTSYSSATSNGRAFEVLLVTGLDKLAGPVTYNKICITLGATSACPTIEDYCYGWSTTGKCRYSIYNKALNCCPTSSA